MLGSAGRAGSLEMSCGVSTWWGGRGARVSWQMSPERKGEWGQGAEESPSFPSQLQCQAFDPFEQAGDSLLSLSSFMGPFFLFRTRAWGTQTGPLSLSCPHGPHWPAHLLRARHGGSEFVWRRTGEGERPQAAGHFST